VLCALDQSGIAIIALKINGANFVAAGSEVSGRPMVLEEEKEVATN